MSWGFTAGVVAGGLIGLGLLTVLSTREDGPGAPNEFLGRGQSLLRNARQRVQDAVEAAREASRETRATLIAEWERAKRGDSR